MSVATSLERYNFRKIRTRRKIFGTAERPRLCVCRSSKHLYAQLVDDVKGQTLLQAGTLDKDLRGTIKNGCTVASAEAVGRLIARRAKAAGVLAVVFDRGAWPYHGRIKAVADGARAEGLKF